MRDDTGNAAACAINTDGGDAAVVVVAQRDDACTIEDFKACALDESFIGDGEEAGKGVLKLQGGWRSEFCCELLGDDF